MLREELFSVFETDSMESEKKLLLLVTSKLTNNLARI